MDKNLKLFLIAILVLLVANLVTSFLNVKNDNLDNAVQNLKDANAKLTSTMNLVNESQKGIDSVRADLVRFRSYIKDMQLRVELLDLERKQKDANFKKYQDSIKSRLNSLYKEIDLTGENLPDIHVIPLDSLKNTF